MYRVHLSIRNTTKQKIDRRRLELFAARTLKAIRTKVLPTFVEVSVVFWGDSQMKKINKIWRGENTTTDVLSFSYFSRGAIREQETPIGEIFISIPEARREARSRGHSLSREIEHLFVHGFLHVLGYDHETSLRNARRMRELEETILHRTHKS